MHFREEINLGFIYIGTLVGAGFASGQEIMKFFTVYGWYGLLGIFLACLFFFVLGYLIMSRAIGIGASSIKDILLPAAGEKLAAFFEITVDLLLLGGYYIMVSGCGAVLWESMRIPYLPATMAICMVCVLWLKNGVHGLAEFNRVIVPVMVILTLFITFFSLKKPGDFGNILNIPVQAGNSWFFSAVLYVSYNMASASVVLASLGTYTGRVKAALGAALIASAEFFIMASALWVLTTVYFSELEGVEIPLMVIARGAGPVFYWASVAVLLSAMLTTALSFGFASAMGISSRFGINYSCALLSLFAGLPFTGYGFSRLIGVVYPLFGVAGIFFGFLLVARRFLSLKRE
jgi:uncharacterized membrane protein YkvI